jgi:hypothetical protein
VSLILRDLTFFVTFWQTDIIDAVSIGMSERPTSRRKEKERGDEDDEKAE